MDARTLARALGGDVAGRFQVVAPGPGHSPRDRSMSVFIDWQAPDGFRVHPHAPGDDWQVCRDYVRDRLGLPRSSRTSRSPKSRSSSSSSTISSPARWTTSTTSTTTGAQGPSDTDRMARALALWQEARR